MAENVVSLDFGVDIDELYAWRERRLENYEIVLPQNLQNLDIDSENTPTIEIFESEFIENLSEGQTSLVKIGEIPWASVKVSFSHFRNNYGTVTNEILVSDVKYFEVRNVTWDQVQVSLEPRKVDKSKINKAKFLIIDDKSFDLFMVNSKFDCAMEFDEEFVYDFNNEEYWGEQPLIFLSAE